MPKLRNKKVWSLSDMIVFMAWQLMRANDMLRDAESIARSAGLPMLLVPSEMVESRIRPVITYCRMQYEDIELRSSVARIDEHILIKLRDGISFRDLQTELRVLRETVDYELVGHQFAYIAQDKTQEFLNWRHTWKRVLETFDEAEKEIDQATICFSLELYSATVFHMMRVAELGLRSLAVKIGVTLKHAIELEDWNTVLVAVDRKLEELHNAPKSPVRQTELKLYSDVASHLRYMKAWRNEMAHARCVYGEGEAKSALTRVRELLELMCP
jgi:hypothetical protein